MKSNKALFLGIALLCVGGVKADTTVDKVVDAARYALKTPIRSFRPFIMTGIGAHIVRKHLPEWRSAIADHDLVRKLEGLVPFDAAKGYGGFVVDAAVACFLYRIMRNIVAPHAPEVVRGPVDWMTEPAK